MTTETDDDLKAAFLAETDEERRWDRLVDLHERGWAYRPFNHDEPFAPRRSTPPATTGAATDYPAGHGYTPSTGPFGYGEGCRVMLARYRCDYTREQHDPDLPPVDLDVFGYRRGRFSSGNGTPPEMATHSHTLDGECVTADDMRCPLAKGSHDA